MALSIIQVAMHIIMSSENVSSCIGFTVVVAHNGYAFGYQVLLSNMERHEVDLSWFESHNVEFADSLHYLREVSSRTPRMYVKNDDMCIIIMCM